jgi:DNA-binding transcriptional ArsR family regulator
VTTSEGETMRDEEPPGERSGSRVGSPRADGIRNEVFRALAHTRRRRVLAYLRDERRAVPVEHVATYVATAETTGDADAAYTEVETSLYHVHLPKLIDAGLLTWVEPDRRTAVELTTLGAELPPELEWVPADLPGED